MEFSALTRILRPLLIGTAVLISTSASARFEDWKIDFENNSSLVGVDGDTLYLSPVPGQVQPTPTGTTSNNGNWTPQTNTYSSNSERELLIEMLRDLKASRDEQQTAYDDPDSEQYQKTDTKNLIDQMNLQIANLQTQIDALAGETINENLTCSAYCAQKRDQLELILKDVVCMSIPSCAQCRLAFSAMALENVETSTLHIGDTGQRCNAYQQATRSISESRGLSRKYHFAFGVCLTACATSLGLPFSNPFCDVLDFGVLESELDAARASLNESAATDPEVIDAIKAIGGGPLFQQSVAKKTQGALTEEIIQESAKNARVEFAIRKILLPSPCAAAAYIMRRMLQAVEGRGKIEETKTEICDQIETAIMSTQVTSAKLSACIVMACALQPGGCKNQDGPNNPNPNPSPTKTNPDTVVGNGPGGTGPGGSTIPGLGNDGAGSGTGTGAGTATGGSPYLGLNPESGDNTVTNPINGSSNIDSREITYVDPKSYSNLTAKEKSARTATEERIREITSALDRNADNPLRALREINPNLTDGQMNGFQKALDAVTPENQKKYSLGIGDSTSASKSSSDSSNSSGSNWGSGSSGSSSDIESISGTLDLSGGARRKPSSVSDFENGIHLSRNKTIFEIVSDQYENQVKQGKVKLKSAKRASRKVSTSGSISPK